MTRDLDNLLVREEQPEDFAAIREVNRLAFGQAAEAALIDRLRAGGHFLFSLVALSGECVVGHILFTRLPVETASGVVIAAALAPMAVLPEFQRRGVGSALVRKGLESCRLQSIPLAVVVGHPDYYPRFGFSASAARGLESPFSAHEAFMALELTPDFLTGFQGVVQYPEPFFDEGLP